MTGTLLQVITLIAYGNNYLQNREMPASFDSVNTAFQFCNKVDFNEIENQKEKVIAATPTKWFECLKAEGCKHLRIYFEYPKDQSFAKPHMLAGFVGGGGTWLIEAIYDNYSNFWAARWEVTNRNAPDRKIWTVNYRLVAKKLQTRNQQIDNQSIKNNLRQTLTEISDFALKNNQQYFGEVFIKAKNILDMTSPEENYYPKDLLPFGNYSPIAKQLLFSANVAWVFGGMGSWNDLGFKDKESNDTYARLSEQLYSNIIEAIIAGINTY